MRREVVISGIGTICALGLGKDEFWNGLVEGICALRELQRVDADSMPCRLGGESAPFEVRDFLPKHYRKATKVMARDTALAVTAASLAVADAGLVTRAEGAENPTLASPRLGCQIGAGLIAAEADELGQAFSKSLDDSGEFSLRAWGTAEALDGSGAGDGGMNHLPPLWLLKYLPNMLACHVTILHGAEGPSNTITCAEASGLLSIGESMRVIQRGDADACFSGGAESKLNYMAMTRMDLAGRIAHTSETDGTRVVRPYSPESVGGVLGEAGAVLIVEEREHARARGAQAYARISGFGAAQTRSALLPTGVWEPEETNVDRGLVDAIESALRDAGLSTSDIDAIVPLGLGVRDLDTREAGALREVFGPRLGSIPLLTITPNLGNCSAGQGGLMAAAAALAIRHQALSARIQSGAVADGLDAGRAPARSAQLGHVLVCAPALGGQNAALILSSL
ncbi:MAG: hypothetical protein KF757_06005 [Phycisphaeraceae bacterium]|nr:hypothetical protein [Phycisphaeraceae bacterium]MCW5763727.1 hypothetical protein [Phycisphaeraceae bacterium]